MQGTYKTQITEHMLRAVVQNALGQRVHTYDELADGWANTAYRITTTDGSKFVLKVAPSKGIHMMRCEQASMRTEIEAMRLVAQAGDVPVPHVHVYDPSCTLVPSEYFIMDFVEGVPYNKCKETLTAPERADIERQLAGYCRKIHAHGGQAFGYFLQEKGWAPTWRAAFETLVQDVLADGQDAGMELPEPYAEIEGIVSRLTPVLDVVTDPQLIHWDLWEGNFFVHENRITGIVDFERAIWADGLMEHFFGRFSNTPAFNDAYLGRQVDEAEKARRVLYDFYLDLVLVIECAYRNYENADHVRWTVQNFQDGFSRLKAL